LTVDSARADDIARSDDALTTRPVPTLAKGDSTRQLDRKAANTDGAGKKPVQSDTVAPTPEHIDVIGRLNKERARIFPGLGAVDYHIDQHQIDVTPGGQNAAFNQILLRVPGVVLDSYGEVHVRGEHGGLACRVNGVLLPKGLNGFGQELDTRVGGFADRHPAGAVRFPHSRGGGCDHQDRR